VTARGHIKQPVIIGEIQALTSMSYLQNNNCDLCERLNAAMKIKLLGIEMKPGHGITLADMFEAIRLHGGNPVDVAGHSRFTYVDKVNGFHVGLVITTKDHNKFLEFKRDKASAKLEAREVSEGAKLADFNFFAINEKTGKGIYQYYHQSCSINVFGHICKNFYDQLKKTRIEAAKNASKDLTEKVEKQINKTYSGTLKWEILVRQESFAKLLRELKSISAVTLSVSTLAYSDTVFSPIAQVAKNLSQRFTFGKGTSVSSVASSILGVAKGGNVEGARVEGIGEDGLEQVIKMFNTPDIFGEYDFDAIVASMTISPSDFSKSDFLKAMIKVATEEPVIRDVAKK